MERMARGFLASVFSLMCAGPAFGGTLKCPPDSVKVGNVCIDKYEASVWQIDPVANAALVKKVEAGKATLADLTGGGATQLPCPSSFPANFPLGGQWTPVPGSSPPSPGIYAASIAGVVPTACIDWFQAAQACRLSGKRLLTNLEWQDAAAGTPDPGNMPGPNDCNTNCGVTCSGPAPTSVHSNCKSSWGTFDMVGNLEEWVADWVPQSTGCGSWGSFSDDYMCLIGASASAAGPGVLIRGGSFLVGTNAGVFSVAAVRPPNTKDYAVGFRCAR